MRVIGFTLVALFSVAVLGGCASKINGRYVILGMDYDEVKSIIKSKEDAKTYIENVSRNEAGDSLIISYVRLDGDKSAKTAVVHAGGVTIVAPTEVSEELHSNSRRKSDDVVTANLPWASGLYDKHPETGQLLIKEDRWPMPRCYEYNPPTKARRKVGFARGYMFYVRREFAKTLPLKAYIDTKEPKDFREDAVEVDPVKH